ncbi:MAG: hypothetical protein R6V12_01990 [Candidatus Hydrogenedentota bacterium]
MRYHTSRSFRATSMGKTAALVVACCLFIALIGCPKPPQDQEEPADSFACVEEAGALYESLLDAGPAQEAREEVVAWLLTQPEVEDAGIASCGTTVWVHLEDGTTGGIMTETFPDLPPLKHTAPAPLPSAPPAAHAKLGATTFFMSPFRFQFKDWEEAPTIQEYYKEPLTSTQLGVEYLDGQVTVDAVRGFLGLGGRYPPTQLIYSSHGGITRVRGFSDEMGIIATGEKVTSALSHAYAEELQAGRVVRKYIPDAKGSYYCFTPEFVRYWTEYFNSHAPDDHWHWLQRYVYISTCHSAHPSWPAAFTETGAVYYAGYDGKVYSDFASETGIQFFEFLAHGETILDAYNHVEPKWDPKTLGFFDLQQVASDARVFYRGFFSLDGEQMATSSHDWLGLGPGGITGGICVDTSNDSVGSLTIQLNSLETGTQTITEGSDAVIEFIDPQGSNWTASGTLQDEHNAPCGGEIRVIELEHTTGTPVRFEVEATLAYTVDFDVWETKTMVGEFIAINLVGLGDD